MIDWDLAISTGTRWARPGPQVSLTEARRTVWPWVMAVTLPLLADIPVTSYTGC